MQIKYDLDKVGIGSRLQEERIRAGHTQESLAEAMGITDKYITGRKHWRLIEPGILTAYYWIIIAADETGNSTAREKFLQKAAEDLIDEENEKLKKLLALQNHMS